MILACLAALGQVKMLQSGETRTDTVNPFPAWSWYELSLRSGGGDDEVLYNALVSVDSETFVEAADEWTLFDVIILNGTLPSDALTGAVGPVATGNPTCWSILADDCEGVYVTRYSEVARVTCSFGYNSTAAGGQQGPLSTLYIGVRENSGADGPITFSISATTLPRVLVDGLVTPTGILPPPVPQLTLPCFVCSPDASFPLVSGEVL